MSASRRHVRLSRSVHPHALGALNARLAELRARPARRIEKLGGSGRSITLGDISQYVTEHQ